MIDQPLLSSLSALLALIPALLVAYRPLRPGVEGRDVRFWAAMLVAACGPAAWSWALVAANWLPSLATALWVTVAACMTLFVLLCAASRAAWRLSSLLVPYLLLLGLLAALVLDDRPPVFAVLVPDGWIGLHIALSVVTYALVTLAAVAAVAAFVQERALKTKRPTLLSRTLPAVTDSETLQRRLLALAEAVLGAGLLTGMAVLYYRHGNALRLDHKILLSFASFLVIGSLLIAHARYGVRGRVATRLALSAYLLLTLAYPGVKFVREILIGTGFHQHIN